MIIKKNKQKNTTKKQVETSIPMIEEKTVSENIPTQMEENSTVKPAPSIEVEPPKVDLFDIETIDFNQRKERRRGSRRRGYRRIDDRNLVSRAQEEAENIKKSAFEEGYRKGIEKSTADIDNFRNELQKFMNARKDVFEYIAPDIMEISVNIAKTIIKKELETDPQALFNIIIDVLKTVSKNEPKIVIRVNPQSVQVVKDTIPNITYQYGIESKINIVSDPSIEDGGCVFQTNNGIVDASVDTQLEIIKKALNGM